MRIIIWNCRYVFSNDKIDYIAELDSDLLVIYNMKGFDKKKTISYQSEGNYHIDYYFMSDSLNAD